MKTYWAVHISKKHRAMSEVIKRLYLNGISFPFQVRQLRSNPGVVVLPSGKPVAKDFFEFA